MTERDPQPEDDFSEDGVDLMLIRRMLSLTPAERQFLQRVNAILAVRKLIWSDLVKLSGTRFWFFLFCAPAPHVPAGAARRDSHLA